MGQKTQYSSSQRDMTDTNLLTVTLEQQQANYASHVLLHHICFVCLITNSSFFK